MNARSQFEGLLDRYFEQHLADHPLAANHAGLKSGEGRLPVLNGRQLSREHAHRLRALAELESVNPRELTGEQQLDRLALRAWLMRGVEDYARGWNRLNPEAPDLLLNTCLRELQRGEDEPARATANLLAVLRAAPDFLDEAAGVVEMPEALWSRVMRDTCAGAGSLLDAVETFLAGRGLVGVDRLTASVRKSVAGYADRVAAQPVAPAGSFALGAELLQRRVRDELGLDYTLGQIESLALAEAGRIGDLLARACARFGRGRQPDEIIAEARAAWNPGEDLLGVYRAETARMARGFRTARAVTFPQGDELDIRLVPEFMRHLFPTAAYSSPGAFEKRQRGIFWVNDLSVTRKTEAEQRAERQQHFGLSLTAAHEAYPGHHLQFVTANRHPRRWRRLFAHAVFYEGWTLWCEQMLVDLKLDSSPWIRVQQLHDALWRVHRILVDLRLQTGRYSAAQAAAHLRRHLGFTKARAEAEINWYSMAPGVPMSYWLGRLENARLHDRLVTGRGWKLARFNDWLLSFGTLPQGWIEKYGLD